MATWRKVIVSGSDAELRSLNADVGIQIGDNQIISASAADTKLSGSFTGSFTGNFTAETFSFDMDAFGADNSGETLTTSDVILVSDNGTDGRGTIGQLSVPLAGTNLEADNGTIRISTSAAGDGLTGGGVDALSLDTGSTHFLQGVKQKLDSETVISSSAQVIASSVTGIDQYAQLSGSNTFTGTNNTFSGVVTVGNATNSANYTDGALIVSGGVGIAKDVNISGSLNVTGLLTVVSMSTQYVTSSQYTVGTSRIILNDDDLVRFAGLTIMDSGSTAASASILWDSLNNHFVYVTDDIVGETHTEHSAVVLAGPETYDTLGNEIGLTEGRVPVATSDHNLDNRAASSSIRIDFGTGVTHIENSLIVTGSISGSSISGSFFGDGSQLTGLVTNLSINGSESGTTTIDLKTEDLIVSGGEGIDVNVTDNTITISGEDASTSNKGIASFSSTFFTTNAGAISISASAITPAELNTSVAGTGLSGGGGTALSVDYGALDDTAVEGSTTITINGTTNEIEITGTAAQALGGAPSYTIGLPDDVTITKTLTAGTGSITGNLTVGGNLTVQGDTTTLNVTNLTVEDKFILLASGSTSNTDGGIVVASSAGAGHALYYDAEDARWGLNENVTATSAAASSSAYVANVVDMSVQAHADNVATYAKVGNIKIENGEIFIWA
jgi:hypothetical protein